MTSEMLTEEVEDLLVPTEQEETNDEENTICGSAPCSIGAGESAIYSQIAKRCGGNLYIGVVGPVRSGKSTFIRKFMQQAVVPVLADENERARVIDQIPQSSSGRTIMTTEPKFVPEEAVTVSVSDNTALSLRLIDCVGFPVNGALGTEEDGEDRLVKTPWFEEEIPFSDAARIGTEKVICEHATVGILMTSDGSFTGISRESYESGEREAIQKLKEARLPFAIVLNVKEPEKEEARALALKLEEDYGVSVALVSCVMLENEDIQAILDLILREFPLKKIAIHVPPFLKLLPSTHHIAKQVKEKILFFAKSLQKFSDISLAKESALCHLSSSVTTGEAEFSLSLPNETYYECLSELSGMAIRNEADIVEAMSDYARIKSQFERLEYAWGRVNDVGYGIVMPSPEAMALEEPTLVKTASGYGVRIGAKAECIHMIRTSIETEFAPVVGTQEQAEEVIRYLEGEYMEGDGRVFRCNMFGKSLYDLTKDALSGKLEHLPDEAREKIAETLGRIVNEGANGLICILL
ncbi:MAG: stage IV sporulation protein A [Clostridia bacterium]|nr:stage IV sporulation protein A [Clostridia bacterium]